MKTGVLERQRINPRNKIKKLAGRDQNLYNYEESSFYQTTPTLFKTRHLQMMSKADDLQAASATLEHLANSLPLTQVHEKVCMYPKSCPRNLLFS